MILARTLNNPLNHQVFWVRESARDCKLAALTPEREPACPPC